MKSIRRRLIAAAALAACAAGVVIAAEKPKNAEHQGPQQPWSPFKVHDMTRPVPPIVAPGTPSTQEQPGKAPSDAIILFDGKDLSEWQSKDGSPPTFSLKDGVMLSTNVEDPKKTKDVETKQRFGDVQLHVEWAEPTPGEGTSQGRGNSGVFLMGLFETQVLDNFNNPTYPDGQCGSVYGQYPPQVNVCKPPGEWQTYDIIFHHPRYEGDKMIEPAFITTIQNGVLIQDHQRIEGPTGHMHVASYPEGKQLLSGPVALQFHHNAVHYRNIWVRPLEALEEQQHTGKVAEASEKK
jgi:hypothetical protein